MKHTLGLYTTPTRPTEPLADSTATTPGLRDILSNSPWTTPR
ncbi:hypothetical protein ABZ848_10815 [Streptomyces sp. NPDC047081]